jgi:phosphopantothenoylcysteine decarboxylase/phosphopantothenate--cysteine ligase
LAGGPLHEKRIVLGVSGSIAAYKAVDLASKLAQAGANVETVLTASAARFVSPLSFSSVTGRPAYTDDDLWGAQAHVLHIGLGQGADLLAIVPATAQTMAKMAAGLADNLLTLTALAARCPVLIAPAMDAGMFSHPATQANLRTLQERGVTIVGPEKGRLASGLIAEGRMTEPAAILGHIRYQLSRGGPLQGHTVVVTAGGTQEPIDPVRMVTNRSSGKQGLALARAALDAGGDVVLVATPVVGAEPVGARRVAVSTAAEMADTVLAECRKADVLIMAAAVADFRPVRQAGQKLKKREGVPTLEMEATADILAAVNEQRGESGRPHVVVGFAAETENLTENARQKLEGKGLDLIVANDVGAADSGFAVDTNRVTLLEATGREQALPLLSKDEVARQVVDRIVALLTGRKQ